ncbi:MAG: hypothetical protein Q9172_003154 [Xanthocarpia lactea]
MPWAAAEEASQNEGLPVHGLKILLQRAEQRLTGLTPPQAHPPRLPANAPPNRIPKLDNRLSGESYITSVSGIARIDPAKTIDDNDRRLASQTRQITASANATQETQSKDARCTAGSDWFHLPRTNLTPELKRDLQLLKMRSTWDPKRHYKNDSRKPLVPEYSQVGTIIEGPTEHYSSRIVKRDRKKSFVDEIRAAEDSSGRFKNKSFDIQASKTSGRRAFYNKLKQKRSKGYMRP